MTGVTAKIIADSKDSNNNRITTFQLRYQRFFHSELMTHRVFSRNASSSRAIPVSVMVGRIHSDIAMPSYWGENKAGMQASTTTDSDISINVVDLLVDSLSDVSISPDVNNLITRLYKLKPKSDIEVTNKELWNMSARLATGVSQSFADAGYHKQISNRITEPYQFIDVIVTSTEWDNYFKLRNHPDAQPEFKVLANLMEDAINESTPILLGNHQYHLPYVTDDEFLEINSIQDALLISAARCARVSYLKHDGTRPAFSEDLKLAYMLLEAGHYSPFEHQAQVLNISNETSVDLDNIKYLKYRGLTHIDIDGNYWSSNLKGFGQFRNFYKYLK